MPLLMAAWPLLLLSSRPSGMLPGFGLGVATGWCPIPGAFRLTEFLIRYKLATIKSAAKIIPKSTVMALKIIFILYTGFLVYLLLKLVKLLSTCPQMACNLAFYRHNGFFSGIQVPKHLTICLKPSGKIVQHAYNRFGMGFA